MSATFHKGPLPRYYQLKEIMREKINSGEWKPGDIIPSERELGEQYGISRMTARQAITELVNEGLFYREQGKGTFVSRHKITQQLIHLTGFTEDIRARGQRPSTRVLAAQMQPADEHTAERLRIKPGQPVFCLQRLRLADGEPLALETSQLCFIGCEKLLEEDFAQNSLYHVMETRYGILLVEAEQEIEAGLFDAATARILNVPVNSAALFTRRVTYTERDQPIEFARAIYRGDQYTYYTHMKREQFVPQ